MQRYPRSVVLAIDQGTTSSRCIAFNKQGQIHADAVSQQEFEQIMPQPGWVEHDPKEIWKTVVETAAAVAAKVGGKSDIAAIGARVAPWQQRRPPSSRLPPHLQESPISERQRSSGTRRQASHSATLLCGWTLGLKAS